MVVLIGTALLFLLGVGPAPRGERLHEGDEARATAAIHHRAVVLIAGCSAWQP
jgi:hypothetical protein